MDLPEDLEASLRATCGYFGVDVGLWHGEVCVFSSNTEWIEMLGSFVLGGGEEILVSEGRKMVMWGGRRVDVLREDGVLAFVMMKEGHCDTLDDIGKIAVPEMTQVLSAFVESFGWSGIDTRHVPGSRYCVGERGVVRCSPRGKVSSSSHHVRALATALLDSVNVGETAIYTCDRTGDAWGCYSSGDEMQAVSVTLAGGMNQKPFVDEMEAAKCAHFVKCLRHNRCHDTKS